MKRKKAVLLDINIFSQEGFTNGIFLTFREFFKRFEKKGIKTSILSLSEAATAKTWDGVTFGKNIRRERGIKIEEMIIDANPTKNIQAFLKGIDTLLTQSNPDLIFMYTPAVFFEEIHLESLKKAIDTKAKVVILLADSLYPTIDKHPKEKVLKYYKLLKKTEVLCTSKVILKKFEQETGIKPSFFPNIFSPEDVIAKKDDSKKEYITLVNHHPIKGIQVFNEIAKKMPEKKFLVVETWPDVPDYIPPTPNIVFSKFIKNVKELYSKTKIILMPSLYEEGPSRLMIESMLNHIPVIAHKIGSLTEVGDDFALFIDPPQIETNTMIGTVIYPKISDIELKRTVKKFVNKINEVDSKKSAQKYRNIAYEKAIQHCDYVEKKLEKLIDKWFFNQKGIV